MATKNLKTELATDVVEKASVVSAETAALADGVITEAEQAIIDAAKANVNVNPTLIEAAKLSICDFGMVSNDMARAILEARGVEIRFEEPENVESDYNMRPYKK